MEERKVCRRVPLQMRTEEQRHIAAVVVEIARPQV